MLDERQQLIREIAATLEASASRHALGAISGIVSELESRFDWCELWAVLLATGEQGSLLGLSCLSRACAGLLKSSFADLLVDSETQTVIRRELRELEERLKALARERMPALSQPPTREADRLNYFLYSAAPEVGGGDDAVEALLPICYRALRSKLRRAEQKRKG